MTPIQNPLVMSGFIPIHHEEPDNIFLSSSAVCTPPPLKRPGHLPSLCTGAKKLCPCFRIFAARVTSKQSTCPSPGTSETGRAIGFGPQNQLGFRCLSRAFPEQNKGTIHVPPLRKLALPIGRQASPRDAAAGPPPSGRLASVTWRIYERVGTVIWLLTICS